MIIFWCEFPEQVNWERVNKEIDFDTEIYVVCKGKREYLAWKKKIKNKRINLGAWPVLDKKDGYWFSGKTSKENIDRLDEFKSLRVKIDIEPRIYNGKYRFFKSIIWLSKWIINPGSNKNYLLKKIDGLHKERIISGFLLPKFLRERVWMHAHGRKNYICYTTLGPKFLLRRYYKFMIKRLDKNNFFAIGLANHGVFGNEPEYKNEEDLIDDLEFMKKLDVKNIAVYSLEGIMKHDWMRILNEYHKWFRDA